ncbi:hypothetical protein H5410_012739 [Solanum commersonii]|uniref:RNase H type-1 domain-containing protein n=1 Tax=Solanum commersonii TaxID=4109 RepID=A0A9J6AT73_SOLCO|nr:hypothetical protein H5410_012739 [Solanum commersonii]
MDLIGSKKALIFNSASLPHLHYRSSSTDVMEELKKLDMKGNWQSPWKIEDTISKIKFLLDTHHIHTTHYMREANKVADKLASLSHKSGNNCIYTNYSSLPRQIIGLLNIDRWQIPSFRVRRRNHGAITFDPP